jgi:tetratricopeptide (TPR) repeat protein
MIRTLSRSFLILLVFVSISFSLHAQKTSVYSDINAHYKEGLRLFAEGVYIAAKKEFETVLTDPHLSVEPEYKTLLLYSEYYSAISSLRMKMEDADLMVTEFIKRHRPDPIAEKANLEVANFHFDQKNYNDALVYYKLMDTRGLPADMLSEIRFKEGYSYFYKKDFKNAEVSFKQVKDLKGEYYFPTNYYLGMSQYFLAKYDDAIASFQVASKSIKYADLIPYYITQIYFSQGQYDKLLAYTKPILDGTKKVDKEDLIRRMVGHTYFHKKDYSNTLKFLEEFEKGKQSLEEADYYALGYSNYVTKKYDKAIPYFTAISTQQSELGQNSNYYLADCYLRSGNTLSARTAFYNVSKLPYQATIREEALFNYGKLSAELGFDRESVTTLNSFTPQSKYYDEGQNIIGDVLARTRDYDYALKIIESIKTPGQKLKSAYQQLAYKRSLQLINDDRLSEAKTYLNKAINPSFDNKVATAALYWQGDIAHRQKDYALSAEWTTKFLAAAGTGRDLMEPAQLTLAYYMQGYNLLKQSSYQAAGDQFKSVIDRLNKKSPTPSESQIIADAYLRSADCSFKRNKYDEAIALYGQVIKNKFTGNDYAQYQTAIIQGLKQNPKEKLRMLNELVKNQPGSKYADEAYYEMAITYTDQDQADLANVSLNRIIKDYPQSNIYNRTLIQLGLTSYNLGNKNGALNYYKEVFRHNPTKEESQDALAAIQEIYVDDLGQSDEYVKFVESIPGYNLSNYAKDSLNYSVAIRYYEDGQYERAVTALTDYIQKFPKGISIIPALFRRGESNVLLKKYNEAMVDYEALIAKGRNEYYDKALYKAASIAYNSQENFDKSFKYYSELTKSNVDENTLFEAQLGAMRSAYRKGLTNEVITYGEKVVKSSQATNEQKSTAGFYLGKIYYDQKNYPRAKEYLQPVVTLSENIQTAEARYLLANMLYIQKTLTEAEKATRDAIHLNSDHPYWVAKCLILLSDIFVDKNDLFNARAALEAVLENYKDDPEISKTAQEKLDIVKRRQTSTSKLRPDSLKANSFFDNN